jgi:hypothetical protein
LQLHPKNILGTCVTRRGITGVESPSHDSILDQNRRLTSARGQSSLNRTERWRHVRLLSPAAIPYGDCERVMGGQLQRAAGRRAVVGPRSHLAAARTERRAVGQTYSRARMTDPNALRAIRSRVAALRHTRIASAAYPSADPPPKP